MASERVQGGGEVGGVSRRGGDHPGAWCGERGGRGVWVGLLMSFVLEYCVNSQGKEQSSHRDSKKPATRS